MKQFIKAILLFSILFFIVDKAFYWKIENLPKKEWDKRLEWIVEGKMNKDILIFGSSRAQHGLYADAIQDSLNLSTHNLGYRGSNIDFHLYLLKKVLKHNKKPKFVILTVDDDREFVHEKTLQFCYDKLFSLVKYQEITNDLIDLKQISPFSSVFYAGRIGWQQFSKKKEENKIYKWTKCGTTLLDFTAVTFQKIYSNQRHYNSKLELPNLLNSFLEFQNICTINNIKIFVVITPNFAEQNIQFVNRVNSLLINKKDKVWNEHIGIFKNADCFSDEAHLNKKGAILYTNEIIKRLKTEF